VVKPDHPTVTGDGAVKEIWDKVERRIGGEGGEMIDPEEGKWIDPKRGGRTEELHPTI